MAKPTKKRVPIPNNRQIVPDLAFGDWVQDNDQWLAPTMKIAGAASMLIPGVGPVIGGALTAGAKGVEAYGQSQDANDSIQAQNMNSRKEAFNQSLAQPTMANGGFINYTGQDHMGPNGGIPIDAQGNPSIISGAETTALVEEGEVAATVDGKPYVFSKRLGTADKANKIKNKYKKRLDVNDKISQETMNRELKALVAENEAKKPVTQNPKELAIGGPPSRGDIRISRDSTDNYPYTDSGVDYPGYQGYLTWTGQEIRTPTLSQAAGVTPGDYNRGYTSPSHSMRGLSNQMWLDQNYGTIEPTARDYGIGTPSIGSIAEQGYSNMNPANLTDQTGAQVVRNPITGPSRDMLRPNLNPIYQGGTLDPVTITAQRPNSGTPTSSVPASGASPINSSTAQSQSTDLLPNMNPDLTGFAGSGVPYPTSLGDVADLTQPLDAVQTSGAGDPQMYDPARAALPGIIGQGIAGVGGNALAAALYKRPDTINPALVNPSMVNYSNERLAARENATLAKRSGLQTLRSVPGSTEAMKAQAGAIEAGVSRGLGQQLGQSYQRQEDVNTGRQFQASSQNAQAKTQADMFNTRMLQDFREKQMGYIEGGVGSVQGALSDYNTASRMGDLMNMEAGRSGYQVIIDPATGKTKLVPVEGFWKNKQ